MATIKTSIENCRAIVGSMKGSANKDAFNKEIDALYSQMNDLQGKIKSGKMSKFEQIDAAYRTLVNAVEVKKTKVASV